MTKPAFCNPVVYSALNDRHPYVCDLTEEGMTFINAAIIAMSAAFLMFMVKRWVGRFKRGQVSTKWLDYLYFNAAVLCIVNITWAALRQWDNSRWFWGVFTLMQFSAGMNLDLCLATWCSVMRDRMAASKSWAQTHAWVFKVMMIAGPVGHAGEGIVASILALTDEIRLYNKNFDCWQAWMIFVLVCAIPYTLGFQAALRSVKQDVKNLQGNPKVDNLVSKIKFSTYVTYQLHCSNVALFVIPFVLPNNIQAAIVIMGLGFLPVQLVLALVLIHMDGQFSGKVSPVSARKGGAHDPTSVNASGQHGTRIEIRSAGTGTGAAGGAVEGSSPPQPTSTLAVRSEAIVSKSGPSAIPEKSGAESPRSH